MTRPDFHTLDLPPDPPAGGENARALKAAYLESGYQISFRERSRDLASRRRSAWEEAGMQLDTTTTNKIIDCLVGIIEPARIIVFGSYARGDANEDSDIDIAAIAGGQMATRENLVKCRVALREAL